METKEQKKARIEKEYTKEMTKQVFIGFNETTTIQDLIASKGLKKLRKGRHLTGVKVKVSKEANKPYNVNVYKTTGYELEFDDGFRYKISSFLFAQLKKRENLNVEYFNKW